MKKLCFLLLLMTAGLAGCVKPDPEPTFTERFDPLFAQVLQERGYIADANNITPEEVKEITKLDVSGKLNSETSTYEGDLTSLKGIEFFESLTELWCDNNRLTSLDVSRNTALEILDCHDNRLTSLNIGKNTTLTQLSCSDNKLSSLDISRSTALAHLSCIGNQLTALNVSKNTALETLSCYDNQLKTLDVSRNSALTALSCDGNQLKTLDVSRNTALTALGCSANQLKALDISKNTAIEFFYCVDNPGNGTVFPVTAWFDNDTVPENFDFDIEEWEYNGATITIDFRKAE